MKGERIAISFEGDWNDVIIVCDEDWRWLIWWWRGRAGEGWGGWVRGFWWIRMPAEGRAPYMIFERYRTSDHRLMVFVPYSAFSGVVFDAFFSKLEGLVSPGHGYYSPLDGSVFHLGNPRLGDEEERRNGKWRGACRLATGWSMLQGIGSHVALFHEGENHLPLFF